MVLPAGSTPRPTRVKQSSLITEHTGHTSAPALPSTDVCVASSSWPRRRTTCGRSMGGGGARGRSRGAARRRCGDVCATMLDHRALTRAPNQTHHTRAAHTHAPCAQTSARSFAHPHSLAASTVGDRPMCASGVGLCLSANYARYKAQWRSIRYAVSTRVVLRRCARRVASPLRACVRADAEVGPVY